MVVVVARSVVVVVAVVAAATVGLTSSATGQAPPTTPTTNLLQGLVDKLVPTTTAPPAAAPAGPAPAAPGPAAKAPPAPVAPPTTAQPADSRVVPPDAQRIIDSVRRTGPRNTTALLDALRRLQDVGFTAEEAAVLGMGRFPVGGPADYRDDWLEARFGPPFHLHQGTDIFAARGTPVRAPADGAVRFVEEGGLGGLSAYVTTGDGTFYYMTHLNGFNRKIGSGSRVKQGEVIAYVGNTGNAANGAPHLHFEIHPGGGAAVNPKPFLDTWLREALEGVDALLRSFNVNQPAPLTAAGLLRRFEDGSAGASRAAVAPLLWASTVSPAGGSLRLAEAEVADLAGRIDWERLTNLKQAEADALREGRQAARAVMSPVTPPAILTLLTGRVD
ncbi:MAG: M23 family metallopeptidase [Actinomycetota bacterium]|nr:M23 family metallopeptidase [Actinomycetota bacterium]